MTPPPPLPYTEQELAAMIHNPEQILVSEAYCLRSACCLIEIDQQGTLALLEFRVSDSGCGF